MSTFEDRVYSEIVSIRGTDGQIIKLAEEFGELMQAISKFRDGRVKASHVASEAADVQILLCQVGHIMQQMTAGVVTSENFNVWMESERKTKLERLAGMAGVK